MDEPINAGQSSRPQRRALDYPPDLAKRLVDLWLVAIIGSIAWFVAFLVLLLVGVAMVWVYTALCGAVLGLVGMAIMLWQRSASRRGSRSAQRGL